MPANLVLTFLLAWTSAAVADTNWETITTKASPECNEAKHCRILESNGGFEISFKPRGDKWGQKLSELEIRDLKTGESQKFKMDAISSIDLKEYFKLYKIKFRPGSADFDLALRAFDSAQGGSVYYYFIYDSAGKKFVMSDETVPQLIYDPHGKLFVSRALHVKYALGSDLKLHKK